MKLWQQKLWRIVVFVHNINPDNNFSFSNSILVSLNEESVKEQGNLFRGIIQRRLK